MQKYSFLGPNLLNNTLEKVSTTTIQETPKIALYFSAKWCVPCKEFTPKLIEAYNEVNKDSKQVEIIFVSGDNDEEEFEAYFKTMPWLSVEFEDVLDELNQKYTVTKLPTLKVIDAEGKVKIDDAVGDIKEKGAAAIQGW